MSASRENNQTKQNKQKPPAKPQPVLLEQQPQPDMLPLQRAMRNPGLASPDDILAMQQTFGNQMVSAMLKQNAPPPSPGGTTIQRALISESERAFNTAKAQNTAYTAAKTLTDDHVTTKEQQVLTKLRGTLASIKSSPVLEKRLKDYIRAYLLRRYAEVISDTSKTRGRKFYFEKAQEERDKLKPLLSKGVTAPETQYFLQSEGFQGGFTLQPEEMQVGPSIDVRSTFIGGKILGRRVRAHLFIVYTSSTGKQWYFRGGPDGGGMTIGSMGEYVPGTVDWDPSAPSVTVLKGEQAAGKLDGLMEATSVIDGMKVPYDPGGVFSSGENCNATAWTILDRAGVPKNKPSGRHPGWGHILGALTKGKEDALPEKEDTSGPGEPFQTKGSLTDRVPVYKDRAMLEQADPLPGQTAVGVLNSTTSPLSYIKYAGDKLGFVARNQLEPRQEPGLPFKITVDCDVMSLDGKRMIGHLYNDDVVTVLEPDFEQTYAGNAVKIGYMQGEEYFKGQVSDFNLEAV